MGKAKQLFVVALFGSILFVTRAFVPSPIDKLLIVVDAVLLALGAFFIKRFGATQVSAVGGVLMGLWRPAFLPFSVLFIFLYGIIVDVFFFLFRINATVDGVSRNKLMSAMALSTLIIAFLSYYVSSLGLHVVTANPVLDVLVSFMGPVSGLVAGYAAAYLWNKYLRHVSFVS